jgi:flavin reductase (DIM6/NTAB) family NADH-FMN oxidoreductase RutF
VVIASARSTAAPQHRSTAAPQHRSTEGDPMPIDKQLFRRVMGNFATGVTVVTTKMGDGQPCGLTATAFTSVSLLPPLVLVCIGKESESYPHFAPAGLFAVNFLSRMQEAISQRFAVSGGDKFNGIPWHPGILGAPILDGAIGHIECRIVHSYAGGDHTIYVGEIEDAAANDGEPLVYFRGAYRNVVL